ncbi:MAG: hypothetical protein ACR2OB_03340 [Solirubrobacteraceae bacterium]
MTPERAAAGAHTRVESGARRMVRAWRVLPAERRLAAYAAIALFVTLFLPWYQETVIVPGAAKLPTAVSATVTGWGAFSFVEAAVLVISVGVLTLLFHRAEGRAFHLPGGDGWVISAAGLWCCLLVVWRIFDKQGTTVRGPGAAVSGIEWGIFVALAVAATLTYAGTRIRAARQPEPPLPGEQRRSFKDPRPVAAQGRRVRSPRPVLAREPPTKPASSESRDDGSTSRDEGFAADRPRTRPAPPERDRSEAATRVRRPPLSPNEQVTTPFDRENG